MRPVVIRFGRSIFRIFIAVIVGLAIYFRLLENRLIFYPERQEAGAPHVAYQDVRFPALDGTPLHGWFIPFDGSDHVFIISHGNAGNIGDRYEMGEWVNAEFRSNVLMYDYRGYGKSEGRPSEAGLYSDLRGALKFAHQRGYSSSKIYLIGQSLGTAVT